MTSDAQDGTPGKGAKPVNKRGAARLAAIQALYQMEIGGTDLQTVVAEFENFRLGKEIDGEQYRDADAAWFRDLMAGTIREQRLLDPLIHTALEGNWPLARLDATLRAILRAGTYELTKRKDVPAAVVITEYVTVAQAFFDEDEPRIINGVLDHIGRRVRADEFQGARPSAVSR